jgi:hypothetical protein
MRDISRRAGTTVALMTQSGFSRRLKGIANVR